jgi:UDPglucose 6-dehydrogenase
MHITVVGAGYVGLPLAAVLADFGNTVWIVRKDKEKNDALKKGKVHIFEPGLGKLVNKNLTTGRFIPTCDYSQAISNSDVVFITVGTPCNSCGEADLTQVLGAAKEIGENLKIGRTIIVSKSTAPPGSTRKIASIIEKSKPKGARFEIAFCPEFLREGLAIEDTIHPNRLVIGSGSPEAIKVLKKIHQVFKAPILVTGIESAELIKYAANSYLALRIVYINEIADICERTGADIEEVIQGIGMDKRIGLHYWYPGLGYGGSCFPKDVSALAAFADNIGHSGSLFEKMHRLNTDRIDRLLKKISRNFNGFSGKTIGVLGLACKQGTDDARESPAIKVVKYLIKQKAKVKAYDPMAMKNSKVILPEIDYEKDAYQVARNADILMVLTDWPEFVKLNYSTIKKEMKGSFIFDSRNILNKEKMKKLGFVYQGVGR